MVERLHPRPEAPSPAPSMNAQPAIISPLSPRATPPTPDHKHADALPDGHDSHSPRQASVTPQEPPVAEVRTGRLKRRTPPSRDISPGSARSTSPEPPALTTVLEKLAALRKQARASAPQLSPPSPPSRQKGKEPADCPPSPSTDYISIRSASQDRSDTDSRSDDSLHDPTPARSAPDVPAARQLEIDTVISRLPPTAPRIEPDTPANVAVEDRLQVDEGFYEESAESHYQAFVAATEELRSKRRPYYRVRTPGGEKGSALVQRRVVQKSIRMRKRDPKTGRVRRVEDVNGEAVASSSGT